MNICGCESAAHRKITVQLFWKSVCYWSLYRSSFQQTYYIHMKGNYSTKGILKYSGFTDLCLLLLFHHVTVTKFASLLIYNLLSEADPRSSLCLRLRGRIYLVRAWCLSKASSLPGSFRVAENWPRGTLMTNFQHHRQLLWNQVNHIRKKPLAYPYF